MTGTWKEIERNQWLSMDCHWNQWNLPSLKYLWISLNAASQARYWVQTHMNTGPKSLRNLFQPGNTKPSKIVASISLTRLSSVRSQPSAMSNDKAAIPNDLAFWPTMPDPENKSRKTFDWPVCCKVSLTSCRYSAAPFFGTDPCAFCFSPLRVFIFFMGLTFWLSWCPFFCWGLAGRRTRFKSWHKHAAQWRYNEVYTKYNDLAMKPTKTI